MNIGETPAELYLLAFMTGRQGISIDIATDATCCDCLFDALQRHVEVIPHLRRLARESVCQAFQDASRVMVNC